MPLYAPVGVGLMKLTDGVPSIAAAGDLPAHTHDLADITDAGTVAAVDLSGNASEFLKGDGSWAAGGGGGLTGDEIVDLLYPVGSIYISTLSTNPGTLLAHGTWAAFGAGRVLVGLDAGQTEFDTVEETGGSKTHTLTTAEMPSHTHTQRVMSAATGGLSGVVRDTSSNTVVDDAQQTGATGGDGAHNNLQPYIVVYMWKRTA